MKKIIFLVSITAIAFLGSCLKDKGKPQNTTPPTVNACDTISYAKHIKPIIDLKCGKGPNGVTCHSGGSPSGGVALTTYGEVSGKSSRVQDRALNLKTMPPAGPLSADSMARLNCWLGNGLKQ